jgi:transcriptional regulator with XRE-family HTH domain
MERVIAETLRRIDQKGMTQAEFCRLIGISHQVFTNWKARGMPPSAYQTVADALGCGVDELLGRESLVLSPIERQLILLFRGCNPEHQDDLVAIAQRWHNHAHPGPSVANPYGKKAKSR